MIISASRRTDIPAFFSGWFLKRLEEQYAYVRNPVNPHQVSRIPLSPELVDCIVFWSKNPAPLARQLERLKPYMYYFQFTLNAYGHDLEQGLPSLRERIDTFQALSSLIGSRRVIWRYDPIIVNDQYPLRWHIETYAGLAKELAPYTETCTISFIDLYPTISKRMQSQGIRELNADEKTALAKELSAIARSHGLTINACAEDMDLSAFGIGPAHCIDGKWIANLLGCSMEVGKDKNQRQACGCVSSIDLGLYNTCQNGCVYCYANHDSSLRARNFQAYDENAPLLCSRLTEADKVVERKVKSHRDMQLRFL